MSDPEPKYAWSEGDCIIIDLGEDQPVRIAFTLGEASLVAEQIKAAIRDATISPFERWWRSLEKPSWKCGEDIRRMIIGDREFELSKDVAQALFDEIRAVK